MVVNMIIMAMVAHELQPSNQTIYHVGSSTRNSMRYIDFKRFNYQYFTEKPWINKDVNAVKVGKVTIFNNMASFRRYMNVRYLVFLKVLKPFFLESKLIVAARPPFLVFVIATYNYTNL